MIDANRRRLRNVVLIVAALNLVYFGIEFSVARAIGSVTLFADSVDFLEDTAVNLLVALALGWSLAFRARVGMALAALLLLPGLATLWMAWAKFNAPLPPEPFVLTATGAGALLVNLSCAFLLTGVRSHGGSLSKAAFLSARNDALANLAIIAAGVVTVVTASGWPDLIVGLGIAALNTDAANEVLEAAREERRLADEPLRLQ